MKVCACQCACACANGGKYVSALPVHLNTGYVNVHMWNAGTYASHSNFRIRSAETCDMESRIAIE